MEIKRERESERERENRERERERERERRFECGDREIFNLDPKIGMA